MTDRQRQVVVIGYGMAAARFAEEVRRRDPDGRRVRLTVIGAEPYPAYNRVLLSTSLTGHLGPDRVFMHRSDWAERNRARIVTGVEVDTIDRAGGSIMLRDGRAVPYDDLVLAVGSRPRLSVATGLTTPGGWPARHVLPFRDLSDYRRVRSAARPGAKVVVLGGGVLGIEVACSLADAGAHVTLVHPGERLMERRLDPAAGHILGSAVTRLGVTLRLDSGAARWWESEGLELDDGTRLPAEAVVVTAGVRPRTGLARRAGLTVDHGIVVDDRLATSDEHVYAIGDCAQYRDAVGALVQSAWEQAEILADRLTGADPDARYRGTPAVTRLKVAGLDVAAIGDAHAGHGRHDEVLRFEDPERGRYAKLVLRDDRVAGAVVLGLPDAAASIIRHFETGDPAPTDRLALLLGRALPPAAAARPLPASDDVVCRCNTVTMHRLAQAWRAGANSATELARETRATTGCGSCRPAVEAIAAHIADEGDEVLTGLDR